MITVKVGNYELLYIDADKVRTMVFSSEQGISEKIQKDEFDKKATHVVVYLDNEPIVAARMILKDGECSIGRVATIKQYRGNGFAKLAMEALLVFAKNQQVEEVILHSQKTAEGFYHKLGFSAFGEPYKEAGIDHISMKINPRKR